MLQEIKDKPKTDNKPDIEVLRPRLLNNRGIGKDYHYRSLTKHNTDGSESLLQRISDYDGKSAADGKAFSFVGACSESYDLTILTARALILKGMNLYLLHFSDLVNSDGEVFSMLADKGFPPICIMDFYPDSSVVDTKSYRMLEALIKKKYLDESVPVFIHFPVDSNPSSNSIKFGDLISPNFIEKLQRKNFTIEVSS